MGNFSLVKEAELRSTVWKGLDHVKMVRKTPCIKTSRCKGASCREPSTYRNRKPPVAQSKRQKERTVGSVHREREPQPL